MLGSLKHHDIKFTERSQCDPLHAPKAHIIENIKVWSGPASLGTLSPQSPRVFSPRIGPML